MTKLQNGPVMIEQVAWNEYSLLLTDMLQNITFIYNDFKTEIIYKSYYNAKLGCLGRET